MPKPIGFAPGMIACAALLLAQGARASNTPPPAYTAGSGTATTAPVGDVDVLHTSGDGYNRMTVSVGVGGDAGEHGPFAFLVDTGAERTVIARTVATMAGLPDAGRGLLISVAGRREVDLVRIETINLGKRSIHGLNAPLLESDWIGADGIIGLDGLQGQRVLLDFEGNRMAIGDPATLGGNAGYDIVVHARRKSGQLVMTDATIDGVRTDIVIDTGADTSVGNRALQRALSHRAGDQSAQLVSVTGQRVNADVGLAREMLLGGLTLSNTVIAFTDAPAFDSMGLRKRPALLLGMAQLRLFHRVAIDFAAKRVLFEVPGKTAENGSGKRPG